MEKEVSFFKSLGESFYYSVIYDNRYGLVLPYVDDSYKDTIIKTLLKRYIKQEEISERIRLLYVALTRAKEKMIIVTSLCDEENYTFEMKYDENADFHSRYSAKKKRYT